MILNILFAICMSLLITILTVAQGLTLLFTAYQTLITAVGMLSKRKRYRGGAVGERYALLVCAHNEEQVVANLVENLLELDYPKSLYDVYVICDNCTDQTEKVAAAAGAIPLVRNDLSKVGKGYGIEWALGQVWAREMEGIVYDAFAIFDADNLVTKNFLRQVSARFQDGLEVVQGYLDSKNPKDSWITKSYAFSYWATARIYQLARENLGMSAQLGGTGLVVKSNILKRMGWGATSLTEDLEFTARYVLETGKRVGWVHEAKLYDEKPLKMKASYRQRMRWMKGHFSVATQYSKPLLLRFLRTGRLLYLDMLIYLIQPSKIILGLAAIGFYFVSAFYPLPSVLREYILNPWVWIILLTIYYVQPIAALIGEKKARYILWVIQTYIFSFSWIPIAAVAPFKAKDRTWTHTVHTRSIKSKDVIQGSTYSGD